MDHDQVDEKPIAATVQLLAGLASAPTLAFDASHLLLHPPLQGPADKAYFYELAQKAQKAAFSQGYSSILAGPGNEGDDTGDVAFWLGEGDFGEAENVLKALGLSGHRIEKMEISSEVNSIATLDAKYGFRIEGRESRVLFFLVGKMTGGWGGLVGAGVWT